MVARGYYFSFFYLSALACQISGEKTLPRKLQDDEGICAFYPLLTSSVPNASEFCSCDGIITCFMESSCADAEQLASQAESAQPDLPSAANMTMPNVTGTQCAENLSANISMNEAQTHIVVDACGTYANATVSTPGSNVLCASVQAPPSISNPTLSECTSVTLGGEPCECSVCNEGMGVDFFCNENVTTGGCQEYSMSDINSLQQLFGAPVMETTDDEPEGDTGTPAGSPAGAPATTPGGSPDAMEMSGAVTLKRATGLMMFVSAFAVFIV